MTLSRPVDAFGRWLTGRCTEAAALYPLRLRCAATSRRKTSRHVNSLGVSGGWPTGARRWRRFRVGVTQQKMRKPRHDRRAGSCVGGTVAECVQSCHGIVAPRRRGEDARKPGEIEDPLHVRQVVQTGPGHHQSIPAGAAATRSGKRRRASSFRCARSRPHTDAGPARPGSTSPFRRMTRSLR